MLFFFIASKRNISNIHISYLYDNINNYDMINITVTGCYYEHGSVPVVLQFLSSFHKTCQNLDWLHKNASSFELVYLYV